ncbi:MAG TPA: helix-turn-helix domain-containing protein [Caulobacteraceae bacterium]|nr:helix-turn-helix domain-containing protein [Caulobacteraceae bacterium]
MVNETASAPSLDAKSLPSRRRGKDTFEAILTTAGALLAEVGFERLTTNLVCERAGLTPPALYRYFPNKYALLAELARRLMDAQDEVFLAWMEEGGSIAASLEEAVGKSITLRKRLIAVTRAQPGGMWILRAIRALPVLREVRVDSQNKVLDRHFSMIRSAYPEVGDERLWTAVRLSEETTYAMIEMILEDPGLDEDQVIEETSWMTTLYFRELATRSAREG